MPIPQFKTYQQILKSLIQQFVYETGVNDLNKGSVVRSLLEAVALSDYQTQIDIMTALSSIDIDRATGEDLDKIGFEKNVPRPQAKESNGVITIYQAGMEKISTQIYQGTAAPPAGSTVINVADASKFPSSGSIYIGRGTSNLEGPIAYNSINYLGTYYQLVLSAPTTKNHNLGESVILAQGGNRFIPAGSIVQTAASLSSPSIQFKTLTSVTLLDGESTIDNVPVTCTQVGTIGNIPAGAIVEFASPPFPNAAATNKLAYVTGRDTMSDADYRELIKKSEQVKSKGTDLAIIQAAIGTRSEDDNKLVVSAEIKKSASREEPAVLYIDDGSGYQPIFKGQGFEPVLDNANGGEVYFQLQNEDLTKALVVSSLEAPFALAGGMKLAVRVGGVLSEHIFDLSDFNTENAATTDEVVNSINKNNNILFSARPYNNNKQIILFSRNFKNEDIQVVKPASGVDANKYLGFPDSLTYTLRLYKNDELLVKDGIVPTIYSKPQSDWSNTIANGATLKIKVDGSVWQNVVINDSDFVPYGYPLVSKNNSLESWANVLMDKIAGITVVVEGNKLKIVSNKGADDKAGLQISSDIAFNSLAQVDNMFTAGEVSTGLSSDYVLNRSTGQIKLHEPLLPGDKLTAGSKYTRGFIDSAFFPTGNLNLASTPLPKLYFIVDAFAEKINTSLSNTVLVSVTNPSGNIWRYTFSLANAITGVKKDDYVIITENLSLSSNNLGYYRVHNVDTGGSWFEVVKSSGTIELSIPLTGGNDFIFVRSPNGELQTVTLPTGTQTLAAISSTINSNILGIKCEVINGTKLRISTLTYSTDGSIFMAGYNVSGGALGFTMGKYSTSKISHTAFNISAKDFTFIEPIHDSIATGDTAAPFTSIITNLNLSNLIEPNHKMVFLNPFGTEIRTNRKLEVDIEYISGLNVGLRSSSKMSEILFSDRYYIAVPFNFNSQDTVVTILDNDTLNKTFNIKLARKIQIYSSPNANTFKAYDIDFGPGTNFPLSFGNNFDFKDFKVHLRAKNILDPSGPNNKMMIKAVEYGPSGEKIKFGIYYPSNESSPIGFSVNVGEFTDIKLYLASDALRTGGTWDPTTEFDVVNISPNVWRYTYNGTGTAPNFLSAGIVVGDLVSIAPTSNFNSLNTGVFKVINITNTYFEVINYTGGVAETSKTLNSISDLKFFPLDNTSNLATLIESYVSSSDLKNYIEIKQMESGAGVVSTSTLDDSLGAFSNIQLVDGENWILSSNIGTNITPLNDFDLKKPLNIFGTDILNEEIYLIPTRSEHLNRFLNRFAVTGLSSTGLLTLAKDAKSIQISSLLFGSRGSVFVTGGTGVNTEAAIVEPASIVDKNYLKFSIDKNASSGFHSGQWIKIENTDKLPKNININPSTQVSWDSQNPVLGKALITLSNSDASNIYKNGYFWTKKYHDGDNTTGIRIEKHGPLTAVMWNGQGNAPNFTKQFNVVSVSRTSGVSTIDLSSAHGLPIGSSTYFEINGLSISSFNGTYRCTATSSTELSYIQDAQPNVSLTFISGTAKRSVRKGDKVILSGAFDVLNHGEYTVALTYGNNTIYLDTLKLIEEDVVLSSNSDMVFYDYDSVRPGDVFSVGSSILDSISPFESHQGLFLVDSLTSSENEIIITSFSSQDVSSITLGIDFNKIKIIEKDPLVMYAKIHNVSISPSNYNYTNIVIKDADLVSKILPTAGSFITCISKLKFSTLINLGEDSYKYYKGLISAVGQKIRGKPSNPVLFPGVAAAGSYIEIDSALPKRIKLSIVIRNKTGVPFSILKSKVQSSVAAYVNGLGVGKPVIFSEIVSVAQSVEGVQAVSISSPNYNPSNDQIVSQSFEKPLIFNVDQDIVVSQAT